MPDDPQVEISDNSPMPEGANTVLAIVVADDPKKPGNRALYLAVGEGTMRAVEGMTAEEKATMLIDIQTLLDTWKDLVIKKQ